MKQFLKSSGLIFMVLSVLAVGSTAAFAYSPNLATVPWLGNPMLPHQVYSGGTLVLQGVATDLDTGAALCIAGASWDSGAGPSYNAGTNGYALEATHTYVGSVGQPFTATLTVTLCDATVLTDTMRVVVRADNQEVRVNMAIDKGLWNLHKRIVRTVSDGLPSGRWTAYSSFYMAATAGVVQAFEINNHRESGDSTEDPYVDDVARGLRYILSQQHGVLTRVNIGPQGGNDPDTNGNGYGLHINYGGHASYLGGQLMDALVASGTPDKTAETGQMDWVRGRTYKDIVQDMLDGYAWGMNDSYGGWHYNYNSGNNDTSASHWWGIGVLASEVWGLDAPDWVKTIQWTNGVPRMQRYDAWAQANNGCYFGYTGSWSSTWGDNQTNVTAAGLILMNADDIPQTDPRYVCAMGWLNTYAFNSQLGNFYTMYQLAKAMRTALDDSGATAPITLLNGNGQTATDWYAAYADNLINNQTAAGAFVPTAGSISYYIQADMATSWGLIMLSPSLFELPPQAVCSASPLIDGTADLGGNVNFDGSQSAHPDPERSIVSYTWDFADPPSPNETGVTTSHSFETVGIYHVVLTVEDDNGNTDTDICQIDVRDNDIPPNADPGGPYQFCLGDAYELDGSASSDLDNDIVSWEWDVTTPINFAPADLTGAIVTVPPATFPAIGLYDIGLQVTDNDGSNGGTDHTSATFTTVTVIPADDPSCNQPPVALCTDVTVAADDQCQGTASIDNGSSDPDGDPLTLTETPGSPYELGDTIVNLTVDDGRAADSCQATVTVVDQAPPVILCPADITLECPADTSPLFTGEATGADNCGVAAISFADSSAPLCGAGTQTLTRTWTATDGAGLTSSCVQTITVEDTTAPEITLSGADQTLECSVDDYSEPGASASDTCDPDVGVSISGTVDVTTPGDYLVSYDAVDVCGNPASTGVRTVTVEDTIAPVIDLAGAGGILGTLWPPDYDLEATEFGLSVTDICDAAVNSGVVISVTSDEPAEDPTGDGNHSPDARFERDGDGNIVGLRLRSERKGDSDGRVYLIKATATDAEGNSSSSCTAVTVAHSQKKAAKDDVEAQAGAAVAACVPLAYNVLGPPPDGPAPEIGSKQ